MDTRTRSCSHLPSPALEGLCLRCLLVAGLEPPEEALPPPEDVRPLSFGEYELLEELGHGGMGIVYKARHVRLERIVALKLDSAGRRGRGTQGLRFPTVAEARSAASLSHPNIVPIYDANEHGGRHYFTMRLMEGGSLDKQMHRFRAPHAAARLLEAVARAVHFGHQRLILHRDLKPANLLLDAADVPHVADFGLAQPLDAGAQAGPVAGTLEYMAPEQAEPRGRPLTVAADVYSLGAILYELLTGRPPLQAESEEALRACLQRAEPLPPRSLVPNLPRDLEALCLKCLRKEPAKRYGSAAELAEDLGRFLRGELIKRPTRPHERVWNWCQRHPLGAGLLATLLWSLSVAAVGAFRIARAQEEDLRRDALKVNLYAARLVAGAVLFELAQYHESVERAAARPELGAALQTRDAAALESFCREHFTFHDGPRGAQAPGTGSPLQRCFVLDTTGRALAHWPPPPRTFVGEDYGWRDYFHAARRLASEGRRHAYVSRAFQGSSDGKNTFGLSVPVYAPDGAWAGVLVNTVASNSSLGSLRLDDSGDVNRTATLVALTDRPHRNAALPGRDVYSVLVHEQLGRGVPVTLEPQTARQLERALPEPPTHGQEQFLLATAEGRALEGYRDPVSDEPGTWLAAFAPVGHTGFAVIVQTRENAVLAVNALLARRIAGWSLPFALGAAGVWLLGWSRYRSSRKRAA